MEITVRKVAGRADEELSLGLYNEVWPQRAVTMDEADSFKRSSLAYGDHVALVDGEAAASRIVAIQPRRPSVGHAAITVLPRRRPRGLPERQAFTAATPSQLFRPFTSTVWSR